MPRARSPHPTIAIFGAGLSGICLGIQLKRAGIDSFTIFEKSAGVGGTWRDNSYPGAACDIPSMFYSFSFELKTDWSRIFAQQPEILEYVEHCTDAYGLRAHIRFDTEVESAHFDEKMDAWRIRTESGDQYVADILASGVGQLNRPFTPTLPGLDRFQGTTFHSARWNHDHDLRHREVAIIGNGASAVQIIPEIAKETKRIDAYQRSANWLIRRNDRPYTEKEKSRVRKYPLLARLQRALIWSLLELRWPAFSGNGFWQTRMEKISRNLLEEVVTEPELQRALTPDYPVGCKRILISDDYYETVVRDDVDVITSPIAEILSDAIRTEDGRVRPVDTIIFATGFRTTEFLQPMEIRGRGGLQLNEAWCEGAEAYLGLALPDFPNFFMMYGPNTNLGHNSIILMIECQVRYIMRCIERLEARGLSRLEVQSDAMNRWREECQGALQRSVWATSCNSWYKQSDGRITNNWPYGTMTYWWRTRRPRFTDFEEHPWSEKRSSRPSS